MFLSWGSDLGYRKGCTMEARMHGCGLEYFLGPRSRPRHGPILRLLGSAALVILALLELLGSADALGSGFPRQTGNLPLLRIAVQLFTRGRPMRYRHTYAQEKTGRRRGKGESAVSAGEQVQRPAPGRAVQPGSRRRSQQYPFPEQVEWHPSYVAYAPN